jgi:ATP-dependent Clp protease ATP-binding subunit ClpA
VKTIIEISFTEARRMGDDFVGTEHLLLGLLIEGEGIGAHVLNDVGANLENSRRRSMWCGRPARSLKSREGCDPRRRGVLRTATLHGRRAGIASFSSSSPGRLLTTATLYT